MINYKNNIYIGLFLFIFVISIINLYFTYSINSSYEQLRVIEKQIDSLSIIIDINRNNLKELEDKIDTQRVDIKETTITKYIRPPFNSSDSSYKYLKGFLR
jgi:hypothetical protein